MIRQFKIYNARGDMIDLTNNGDLLAFNPQGLGVSFSNGFYGANANFLQNGLTLGQKQLELMMMFGHKSHDGYQRYFEFVKFLNHTPYLLEYETSAGVFHRECVLNELTKTELKEEGTLQESFVLDFTTPYFKTVSNKTVIVPPIEGKAGKIYEKVTRKRQVFESVPESYREGDIWYWQGEDFPGRNLLVRLNEKIDTMVQTNGIPSSYPGSSMSVKDIDVYLNTHISFSKTRNEITTDHYFRYAWFNDSDILISRKANLQDYILEEVPSGAVKLRVSYPSKDKVKLEKGDKVTDWSPAPEDLTNGKSSGYFIATKSSNEFNFNDFIYYGQSANEDTYYDKIYDYTYSFDDYPTETEESYYTYDYVYDGYEDGQDGVFVINNQSVYMDSSIGSPCQIIVRGPATNPHWQIVQGSEIVQSDGFNLDIPDGYRLVVSSIPQMQRAVLIAPDGTTSNVWQQQDFSKSNFVTFPVGQSRIIFFNCKEVEFTYREESVVI
ncbi:phage distal tail protein domain-containing protein [Enterococcus sp.]|uniref:phage distal tail protein domain-containing protein n=1 Tax=Enterococcus sp. TaxID=35783 RepID=UPI002FCCA211